MTVKGFMKWGRKKRMRKRKEMEWGTARRGWFKEWELWNNKSGWLWCAWLSGHKECKGNNSTYLIGYIETSAPRGTNSLSWSTLRLLLALRGLAVAVGCVCLHGCQHQHQQFSPYEFCKSYTVENCRFLVSETKASPMLEGQPRDWPHLSLSSCDPRPSKWAAPNAGIQILDADPLID